MVTGASGFAGRHLVRHLAEAGHDVIGVVRRQGSLKGEPAAEIVCDLLQTDAFAAAVTEHRPDGIFHLAAPQVSVGQSWEDPEGTKQGNLETTRAVLEAARQLQPPPKVLIVSSSEVYGKVTEADQPLSENVIPRPDSPYAESKALVEKLARTYLDHHAVPVIIARPFNHIGPGQSGTFAIANFAKQIVDVERSGQGHLKVGNLESRRDFGDVRDIVAGYAILMKHGQAGEIYNIGPGQARSVKALLELLTTQSPAKIEVVVDKTRFRPNDVPVIESDSGKIRKLGWKPNIPIEQTIRDILAEARKAVKNK